MLVCCGNGLKLKPMLIFKRKTIPKINNKHGVSPRERMDGFRADESVDRKSMPCTDRWPGKKKSLLVYDSFEAYVTDTVKVSFKRGNTELAVIPGIYYLKVFWGFQIIEEL